MLHNSGVFRDPMQSFIPHQQVEATGLPFNAPCCCSPELYSLTYSTFNGEDGPDHQQGMAGEGQRTAGCWRGVILFNQYTDEGAPGTLQGEGVGWCPAGGTVYMDWMSSGLLRL